MIDNAYHMNMRQNVLIKVQDSGKLKIHLFFIKISENINKELVLKKHEYLLYSFVSFVFIGEGNDR